MSKLRGAHFLAEEQTIRKLYANSAALSALRIAHRMRRSLLVLGWCGVTTFRAKSPWRRPPAVHRPQEPAPAADDPVSPERGPACDIILGSGEITPQFGVLGRWGGSRVAIDLDGCNTYSLFGVQGFGKSYTLGVIAEMAAREVAFVNKLPSPLGTVLFHYHRSDTYEPEHACATAPNDKPVEVEALLKHYSASPAGLADVVMLTPEAKVEQRTAEYPDIDVRPLKFSSAELGPEGWKFLLGAVGNRSLYVKQIVAIMRRFRSGLTVDTLKEEIRRATLDPTVEKLAFDRISVAEPYIDDSQRIGDLLRPGRTVIVDLRDEWIEQTEALGIFVVLFRILGACVDESGRRFPKLFVFDEAHKYMNESELIGEVVATIREMRHLPASVVIASQDPVSLPRAIVELSSVLILHRMTSPSWLKHLKSAISALDRVDIRTLGNLRPGEALVWTQRSTHPAFTKEPQRVLIRPRFTRHGGATRTAVEKGAP